MYLSERTWKTKMKNKIDIAILGATGVVGEAMLEILAERDFPANKIYALASEKSAGTTVYFGNKMLDVIDVASFDFSKVKIALFSAGASVSAVYAPKAAAAGCIVIDNTSCFRNEDDIPLVIPEVNPECVADYSNRNIIANPNCSTIQMLVALKPIYDAVGIKKIIVATYQSVSGTGKAAISELIDQSSQLLNGKSVQPKVYPRQIAYNVIPHIDEFLENGYTKEEMKMLWETRKILEDPKIIVNATTVRVPVIYGHSEAVTIETVRPLTAIAARELLATSPGVEVIDVPSAGEYPTPLENAVGNDMVYVGRIRNGIDEPNTLNLWIVSDNIRKGAALNSIQIAEMLLDKYL
jgi:aspartate-semialdehyde dehydrogenase